MKKRNRIAIALASILGGIFLLRYLLFFTLVFAYTANSRVVSSPVKIAKQADFRLPAYDVIDHEDKHKGSSSDWSNVEWVLSLKKPLAGSARKRLDRLVANDTMWTHDHISDTYRYLKSDSSDSPDGSPEVNITISAEDGLVRMSYFWWEVLD